MIPAVAALTISDILPDVQLILQNRTDISKYSPERFAAKAIEELTLAYPFEELRTTGPHVSLIPNQYQYPVTFWMNPGDSYARMHAINVFTNYPQNTVAYPLKYETPTGIQPILFIPGGLPSRWSRFGTQIWIGTQPQLPYTSFAIYQKRHPFNGDIASSAILMPPEWIEAVEYATAYRLAAGPLRWTDMAQNLRAMLYGDPTDPSEIGLIKRLWSQQQMDESMHSRNITVRTSRY